MATTSTAVLDRVSSIVADHPYRYARAREPFGVEQQPNSSVDRAYYVGMELIETTGNVGYSAEERWSVTIGLARSLKAQPHTAQRDLLTDITSLVATLARESSTAEHHFEDAEFTAEVIAPDADDAYVVAELFGVANFERAL